ncbi:MAG TPA: hypothetical protein VLL08_18005 [Kineosporiaceae bacterium]|nr:hypothetical protein [Kineosporiaceae bacterium]
MAAHPERLLELAAERATGALYLNGRWGGTVFLIDGRIGYVESVLTPGVEALLLRPTYGDEHGWAELVAGLRRGETAPAITAAGQLIRSSVSAVDTEILRRTALADAALATLGAAVPEAARTRTRFRPGEKHWCEALCTFAVPDVLAEVNRRKTVLGRLTLGVAPRRAVRRVPKLPIERIRLTATQWNIARSADGSTTPLDLAWLLGHGVFATTVAVHQLARLGVVTTDPDLPESSAARLVPARHAMSFLHASIAESDENLCAPESQQP